MLTPSLKPPHFAVWLGVTLASGALVSGARSAAALQAPIIRAQTLSPLAQQTLRAVLWGLSPYERTLVLHSVQALGLARAEAELAQLRAMPPAAQQAAGQLAGRILRSLPPQYHQLFVDGLFEVSAPAVQFRMQIEQYIAARVAAQGRATEMISAYGAAVRNDQFGAFQASEENRWHMAQGGMETLGPFTQYTDPSSGQQLQGYTAPVGTQMYVCSESGQLVLVPGANAYAGCRPAVIR